MEIFQYDFMYRAFLIGIIVGLICPVIGLFIALRRMSMMTDALAHVCLSGVAAGLITGIPPVLSAALFATGGGLVIEKLRKRFSSYSEISIAIIMSTGVALGAIILDLGKGYGNNLMAYLFGSIVAISPNDILIITLTGSMVLILIFFLRKELFSIAFDEENARISRIPVDLINTLFTILTALTIAMSIRVIGILMVSSLMILPVAAAMSIAKSFKNAVVIAVIFAQIAIVIGLFASFYINLAPGGSIVMTSVVLLIGTFVCKAILPKRP